MKLLQVAIAGASLLLTACGTPRIGTLSAFGSDANENTALIRPATKEEKQEKQANLAIRLLVNPAGQGLPALLLSVSTPGGEPVDLGQYESVRVPPGDYVVRTQCLLPGYQIFFNVPMSVSSGNTYLLECTGNTAHSARISYRAVAP